MKLTLGPVLFHWPADRLIDFYARIADEAPVDRVVVGETVCSKRSPFNEDVLHAAAARLERAGKEVALAGLALPTTRRERLAHARQMQGGDLVEIGDLSALRHLEPGAPFLVGPLINVYNETTLDWLASRGARAVCVPPELPLTWIRALTGRGPEVEVWGWGRAPLAISARCYHARLAGRSKDSCQFVCGEDPDGRDVETLDGQPFLAIDGVMTLSQAYVSVAADMVALEDAGVASVRLSPHDVDMVGVAEVFRAAADGAIDGAEAQARLGALAPGRAPANGYLHGKAGAIWVDEALVV